MLPFHNKTLKMADDEHIDWNVDLEVGLFHAMRKHKPVGVNRHFQMMRVTEKLNSSVSRRINTKQIWRHLATLYDLSALNDSESVPFPNVEKTFCLPENDYGDLMDRDFPRMPTAALEREEIISTEKNKEKVTDKPGRGKSANTGGTPASVREREKEVEDSPKVNQRKRTRGQMSAANSPATDTPPASSKRPRRT